MTKRLRPRALESYHAAFFAIVRNKGTEGLFRKYYDEISWSTTYVQQQWKEFLAELRQSRMAEYASMRDCAIDHEWKWRERNEKDSRRYFEVEAWIKTEEQIEKWRAARQLARDRKAAGIKLKRKARGKKKKLAKKS